MYTYVRNRPLRKRDSLGISPDFVLRDNNHGSPYLQLLQIIYDGINAIRDYQKKLAEIAPVVCQKLYEKSVEERVVTIDRLEATAGNVGIYVDKATGMKYYVPCSFWMRDDELFNSCPAVSRKLFHQCVLIHETYHLFDFLLSMKPDEWGSKVVEGTDDAIYVLTALIPKNYETECRAYEVSRQCLVAARDEYERQNAGNIDVETLEGFSREINASTEARDYYCKLLETARRALENKDDFDTKVLM